MTGVRTSRFSATCECGCTITAEWRAGETGVWKHRIGGACNARDACAGRGADITIAVATWWHNLKVRGARWLN